FDYDLHIHYLYSFPTRRSSDLIALAQKFDARLHIVHITTGREVNLFTNQIPIEEKRITSEVCVHHLWFTSDDYEEYGNKIKCNRSEEHTSELQSRFDLVCRLLL